MITQAMYNIGDQVQIVDTFLYPQLTAEVGIVTHCEPPNHIVSVAMYDVQIDNDVYIFYDDELTPVVLSDTIGAH